MSVLPLLLLWLFSTAQARAEISKMESEYLRLAGLYEQRQPGLHKALHQYLKDFPYTTYEDEVLFMEGAMLVERGQYKNALKPFEQADYKRLGRTHQSQYLFYRAYAHLMLQEYSKAETLFNQLHKGTSVYQERGSYYYAYCLYKQQKYEKALPVLLKLENNPKYSKTIPYYITQIYYAQENYDEVRTRAEQLMREQPESEHNGELSRMLGEIYYRDGRYRDAVECLKRYEVYYKEQKQEPIRADLYLLGMAQYHLEDYEAAVKALKQVKSQRDTISEGTYLTMGHCYVRLHQPEEARLNYQAAIKMELTPQVREEAMYNYALCCYEQSTALGESVTAFTDFLRDYPKSRHENEVRQLMCEAFMRSKNYSSALTALDAIAQPTAKILLTKQYLRYQLATDAFVQGNMKTAMVRFTEVITHAKTNDPYRTESYYWRAETAYRLRDYMNCSLDLATYFHQSDASRSPNYAMAHYLKGYASFSLKHYREAEQDFRRYTELADPAKSTYADATNRMGDCAFSSRRFEDAIRAYTMVVDMHATGSDYAMFQIGYARGLQRRYADKVAAMQQLVNLYPKSDYADDALYEAARAQIELSQPTEAVQSYDQLLRQYPNSNLCRKASVEQAMIYRNQGQLTEAIAAYKSTIQHYPSSEEAYSALEGLEAIYVEMNRISDYLAYTKQLGRLNMAVVTKEDSLSYTAAELQYMLGNYREAAAGLTTYLSQHCNGGRYCTTARYYCADSYYRLGKNAEALQEYRSLAEISGNPYMEEACTRVAELSYDAKNYSVAMDYFYRMLSLASSSEKADVARLGVLRCAYQLGRHQTTIDVAAQMLEEESTAEDVREEARYNRAKAYIALGKYSDAVVDLAVLSREVRTAMGAESKYLLAECYYRMHQADQAEQEIMSFAQMETQHQYWLAKSLILLSDINVDRQDAFQARQYLLMLQRNYTAEDDIRDMVNTKLNALPQDEE